MRMISLSSASVWQASNTVRKSISKVLYLSKIVSDGVGWGVRQTYQTGQDFLDICQTRYGREMSSIPNAIAPCKFYSELLDSTTLDAWFPRAYMDGVILQYYDTMK